MAPGSPAACIASMKASTDPTPPRQPCAVGRRSTPARLRPHASQNTPGPGGTPQNGQTRALGSTAGSWQACRMTSDVRDARTAEIGLGLAALGRPGYINLRHGSDIADTGP